MIDSHFHLADEAFEADLEQVVDRARAAGVRYGLCVVAAADGAEAARARRLETVWPDVRFAIGIHPHQAGEFATDPAGAVAQVRADIEANPRARAVGEIGLDYHYDFTPRSVQRDFFYRQVVLAREIGLPVVIHTREATEDTFAILREAGESAVRGVFHCFSGGASMARTAVALGFTVSFSGIVSFPKADAVREAARVVPSDRLLAETDSPYLAPAPNRGARNEPAHVIQVVEALAKARGETVETVAKAVTGTFIALFQP